MVSRVRGIAQLRPHAERQEKELTRIVVLRRQEIARQSAQREAQRLAQIRARRR